MRGSLVPTSSFAVCDNPANYLARRLRVVDWESAVDSPRKREDVTTLEERTPTLDADGAAAGRRGSPYAELSRRIKEAGLLDRRRGYYALAIAALGGLLVAALVAFVLIGDSWWQLTVAAVLAVVFTQLGFLGHDAGHRQIFSSRRANDSVGLLSGTLLIGMSFSWWLGKHNRHHSHPNQVDADPDIGAGVLAWTPEQAASRGSVGRAFARHQGYLFFPLLLLEGLNLHVASLRAVFAFPIRLNREVLGVITIFSRRVLPPDRDLLHLLEDICSQIGQVMGRRRAERQLLEITEREQQRIGRDLHDGLCQQLAGVAYIASDLQSRLEKRSRPEAMIAARIAELSGESIEHP